MHFPSRPLPRSRRTRSLVAVAVALSAVALSGSCTPVCGCSPVIEPDVVTSLEFELPEYVVPVGAITSVRVTPRRADGGVAQILGTVQFTSADTTVLTIDGDGFGLARNVRGMAQGETTLTASYEGISSTVAVRVVPLG